MDHADVREQLEAYALGALEPDEVEATRAHLERCPDCRTELASFQRVVDELPSALAAASPLRIHRSLLRRIVASVQVRPAGRRFPRPSLLPGVAFLAVVLFLGSSLYAVSLRQQLAERQVLGQQSLDKVQTRLSQPDQYRVLEVLDSSTTTRRLLRSLDPDHPDAYGKLWTRGDDADVVVMVNRLPQPGPGRSYVLTLTTADGRTVSPGELSVDRDGFAMLLFAADRKGPAYQSAVVSLDGAPLVQWRGAR
jgi:Anti-sigma-K factor rskA/Putative zinc-finger